MNISQALKYLKCPYCDNHKLLLKTTKELWCNHCEKSFKTICGIPILMDNDLLDEQEKKQIKWFEKHYSQFSNTEYKLENWRLSMIKRILEQKFIKNIKTYLDIGCGATGYTVIEASKRKKWLSFGVDISLEAMLRAKNLAKKEGVENRTFFIVCSAENLPFRTNSIDYVSVISVLEHLSDDNKTIKSISKVLRNNGYFYVCLPNAYKRIWFFLWPIYKFLDYQIGHKRHYSIEGLTEKMPKILKLKKMFYNAHLLKLLQLVLEKFHLIDDRRWWVIEEKDINSDFKGIQLNAIYQKIK